MNKCHSAWPSCQIYDLSRTGGVRGAGRICFINLFRRVFWGREVPAEGWFPFLARAGRCHLCCASPTPPAAAPAPSPWMNPVVRTLLTPSRSPKGRVCIEFPPHRSLLCSCHMTPQKDRSQDIVTPHVKAFNSVACTVHAK